jgi:glycosyltransferase involved in cell wall biosynthesis
MKILFIARTYPPLIGGMERFAEDFYNHLREISTVELLANPGGKKTTIPFFFKTFVFLIFNSKKFDVIHFSDAILSPLFPVVRFFSKAKATATVYGLDIIYPRFGYKYYTAFFLKMADRIFAISQYTMEQCVSQGIPRKKIRVITPGIKITKIKPYSESTLSELLAKYHLPIERKKTLLSLGRLTERKGNYWFLENVFPKLPDEYVYVIAGDGPERKRITSLIHDLDLTDRVFILGSVSEEEKSCLYQIADLFIMPNIFVKNDQEGFGITLIEAGLHGVPVIASKIEGICDAVIDQKTGLLVEEKDAQDFLEAVMNCNIDRTNLPEIIALNFDWKNLIKEYLKNFEELIIT